MTGWKLVPFACDETTARAGLGGKGMRDSWRDQVQAAPAPPEDVLVSIARRFLSVAVDQGMLPGGFDARSERACVEAMRAALTASQEIKING